MKQSCLLTCLVMALYPLNALAGQEVIRTRIDPPDQVVVGQPVNLAVDVLFANTMAHPPRVSIADAPGAQILRFETQALNLTETINGIPYIGQRFTFVIFPRRGGVLELPSPDIVLFDKAGDPAGSAKGSPQHIMVTAPPGLDASRPVLAAYDMDFIQVWTPDASSSVLRPGDALVREIRRTVTGVPTLGMADLRFEAPEGVRTYADPPSNEDRVNRGDVTGTRVDRVTYIFERPGNYELPPLAQVWWDIARKERHQLAVEGRQITVTAPHNNKPAASMFKAISAVSGLWLAVTITSIFTIWLIYRRASGKHIQGQSVQAAWHEFFKTAQTGDGLKTYHALHIWRDQLPSSMSKQIFQNPTLANHIKILEAHLFGTTPAWSAQEGKALATSAKAAFASYHPRTLQDSVLPPLNPGAPRQQTGGR